MNIRGIRFDKLIKSGLVPALPTLLSKWAGPGKPEHLRQDGFRFWFPDLFVMLSLLGMVLVVSMESLSPDQEISILCVVGALLFFGLIMRFSAHEDGIHFTRDLNRIDKLLKSFGYLNGLLILPSSYHPMVDKFKEVAQEVIVKIRDMENKLTGDESSDLDKANAGLRELSKILRDRFATEVGDFGPKFEEADRRLDAAKRKPAAPSTPLPNPKPPVAVTA